MDSGGSVGNEGLAVVFIVLVVAAVVVLLVAFVNDVGFAFLLPGGYPLFL